MPEEGYLVVVEPSDTVAPGKLALDGRSLAKAGLAEGTPVEVSANGKKIVLVVERGDGGAAALNAGDADSIGLAAPSLAKMRKIKPREVKTVTLRVLGAEGPIDPSALRLHLALKPISRGSLLSVNIGGNMVRMQVEECDPEEGLVSFNTIIKLAY